MALEYYYLQFEEGMSAAFRIPSKIGYCSSVSLEDCVTSILLQGELL